MSEHEPTYFLNDEAARAKLEGLRWPAGAVCPRCGETGRIYHLGHIRHGLKKCGRCRKQFTIRTATVFESSHMPLHKWLQAVYLLSAPAHDHLVHRLGRALALDAKSALSVASRLSAALRHTGKPRAPQRVHKPGWPKPARRTDESTIAFERALAQLMNVRPQPRARP